MKKDIPLPLIALSAAIAVSFWSLKPIFISMIGGRASYAEVFLVAGSIAVVASLLASAVLWRDVVRLCTDRRALYGLGQAAISGALLSLWYYGFYRALYGSQKVDATIIAFTWPLISILAMRIFAPYHGRKLNGTEYALIFIAFVGAIVIGLDGLTHATFGGGNDIVYAFVAAFGSGFYLPFAINGIGRFSEILGSRLRGTFFTITVANIVSLILVATQIKVTGHPLYFYAFDWQVVGICAMIGIGTYLLAEITWTWAFSEYDSLTLSSLAYFSPAVSVVLLFVIFGETVAPVSAFGLVLILFSNMTLHGQYNSSNAAVSALIGTIYVAMASQVFPPVESGVLLDMLYFISGLFAILAGFILSRVSGRRAEELDHRAGLVRSVLALRGVDGTRDAALDHILRLMVDIEFDKSVREKDRLALLIREEIRALDPAAPDRVEAALMQFELWYTIHRDRLSLGEKAALWLTGGFSIFFLMLVRDDSPYSLIGLYAFSAGCLLVIFTITDYERNNLQGFRRQILRLQQGFRELGQSYYLPSAIIGSREFASLPEGAELRYRAKDGTLKSRPVTPSRSAFPVIYWSSAALVVAALIVLPVSTQNGGGRDFGRTIRPDLLTERVEGILSDGRAELTVAYFDWDASEVIAHVLRLTIAERFDVTVAARRAEVDRILADMTRPEGGFDIHADFWTQNQPQSIAHYIEGEGTIRLNDAPYLGLQGIYLPQDQARALDIATLADLRRPEVIAAFDEDGDGKGEIWIGAKTWISTERVRAALRQAKLLEDWTPQEFSDRIFKAKLEDFVAAGRPIIFYGYEPDSIHAIYELREISRPYGDCSDPRRNLFCALNAVDVHVAYATRLEEAYPEVATFLSHVSFGTADVNRWLARIQREGLTPEEVARDWVAHRSDRVEDWANAAD